MTLETKMNAVHRVINAEMKKALPIPETRDAVVSEAMRYSAIGTGKALRPFLTLTISDILGLDKRTALRIAISIEMMHTYSLIHDDLPSMDNDTLRRGKPTNHIQFGEAIAILAGDALQAKSFEILADTETHPDGNVRSRLVLELAKAAGVSGMVGGQVLDLLGETTPLTLEEIERMQALKTGALLYFSCIAPAIAIGADKKIFDALSCYAQAIGLLFQITDDILDVEGDTNLVGKTLRKDSEAHKSTFVSVLGLEKARQLANSLAERAKESLSLLVNKSGILDVLTTFILERKR